MQVRSQTTSHERELSKVVIIIGRAGDTHANKGKSVLSVARESDMYNQQGSISNYRSRGRTLPFLLFSKSGSRYQRTFARPLPGMPRTALASREGISINQGATTRCDVRGKILLTCACVVRAMSSELAPYSSARTPSAIISPAFGPAIKEYKNEPESTATQGRSI